MVIQIDVLKYLCQSGFFRRPLNYKEQNLLLLAHFNHLSKG